MKQSIKRVNKPIKFRQSLFWDTDPKTLDPKKHADYIIERILDFGGITEMKWMAHQYPAWKIKQVMRNSRTVSDKAKSLWSMVF